MIPNNIKLHTYFNALKQIIKESVSINEEVTVEEKRINFYARIGNTRISKSVTEDAECTFQMVS